MKHGLTKSYMLNTLLTIGLCAAYCLWGGVLQLIAGLLISALLGVTLYRQHYAFGILNSLLVVMIFSLFAGAMAAVTAGVPLILLGLALALGTRFKMKFNDLLAVCAFVYIANVMLGFVVLDSIAGESASFSAVLMEMGENLKAAFAAEYQDPEIKETISRALTEAVNLSIMLSPAIFMILSLVQAYLLLIVYKKLQMKNGVDMSFLSGFDSLRLGREAAIIYLVLFVVLTGLASSLFADAAANVLLVMSFLYMFVGMSVFESKMKKNGTPKLTRRLVFIGSVIFSTTFLMLPALVFVITGLLDSFLDYRKLRSGAESDAE